jgi:hypothetical protein
MVDAKMNSIDVSNNEEDNGVEETGKQMDIWKDETCMVLLSGGILDQVLNDVVEVDRAKRRLLNYHWREDTLFFKDLVVPKPEERHVLVKNIHKEIGHFSCRNPTLAKCGGEAQHLEKLEVGSLPGLPNVQSSTARGKTPRIGVFLMSLERS